MKFVTNFLNNLLKIIKTLCSREDLNSGFLHTMANKIPRCLKVKRQWKQIALQWAENALYRETVEMLLQRNSELELIKLHYSGGLLQ
jgi:hypothetical protein